ncbi:ATP-grasp domain-containing protein [Herbidospora daliensis]|uniref:ATP-grasp domain-containing protein n=1 Tax=Herbidospora daliensis TaxID=295585 RepID=UPI0018DE50A1|nr:hypothetical protein [Herbidospora daliensis]
MNGERDGLTRRRVVNGRALARRVPWPHRGGARIPTPHRGTVALVGAGGSEDTASLLAQVRRGGFDVVLVDTDDVSAGRSGHTDRLRVPAMTPSAVAAAVEGFSRRVDGVICWEPRYQEVAAAAAVRLGLPSFGETAAIGSADPVSTQVLLAAGGMRTPRSILAVSPEEADRAAQLIGCPVLFVARTPGGNLSRRRVDDLAGIPAGFAGAQAATGDSGAVLVEEVPVGAPVTVECWVRSGAPIAVAVIRRFGEYDIVDAADPLLDDGDVGAVIATAVSSVGVQDGHCGVSLLLSDDAALVTGLRPGPPDPLLCHVVELVTGVNLPAAAAAISCGREPEATRHRHRRAAIVTPVDIRAPRLADLEDDLPYAGWLERYEPGGRAVVTGRNPRECALRAAHLRAAHLRAAHLYIPAEWPFLPPSIQRIREPEPVFDLQPTLPPNLTATSESAQLTASQPAQLPAPQTPRIPAPQHPALPPMPTPAPQPAAQTSAPQPVAQTPAPQLAAQTPAPQPVAQTAAPQPTAQPARTAIPQPRPAAPMHTTSQPLPASGPHSTPGPLPASRPYSTPLPVQTAASQYIPPLPSVPGAHTRPGPLPNPMPIPTQAPAPPAPTQAAAPLPSTPAAAPPPAAQAAAPPPSSNAAPLPSSGKAAPLPLSAQAAAPLLPSQAAASLPPSSKAAPLPPSAQAPRSTPERPISVRPGELPVESAARQAVLGAAAKDAAAKDAAAQNKAIQNGMAQNKAIQNGMAQNGAAQNGAAQNGAAQNGAAQNEAAPNGVEQDRAEPLPALTPFTTPLPPAPAPQPAPESEPEEAPEKAGGRPVMPPSMAKAVR